MRKELIDRVEELNGYHRQINVNMAADEWVRIYMDTEACLGLALGCIECTRDVITGTHAPPPPQAHVIRFAPAVRYPEPWINEPDAVESTPDDELCQLCKVRKRATVTQCGHVYACVTCITASRPTVCGLCRQPLVSVIRVYL